jgi:hypothetical protein
MDMAHVCDTRQVHSLPLFLPLFLSLLALAAMALPLPLQSFLQDLSQAWQARVQVPEFFARFVAGESFNYTQLQSSLQQVSDLFAQ